MKEKLASTISTLIFFVLYFSRTVVTIYSDCRRERNLKTIFLLRTDFSQKLLVLRLMFCAITIAPALMTFWLMKTLAGVYFWLPAGLAMIAEFTTIIYLIFQHCLLEPIINDELKSKYKPHVLYLENKIEYDRDEENLPSRINDNSN